MEKIAHSVTLVSDLCVGCTTCVKRCPTEAIRVRNEKAVIIKERCIDCGECIRVCPHHAKKAVVDPLSIIDKFEYSVAMPAPTLYGQFSKLSDRNELLTALRKIGFDDVFEVSAAAEAISAKTRLLLKKDDIPKPVISTACPAVLRIIQVRFPSLLPHLLEFRSPMELAARWAKRIAVKKTGLPEEKIGCIFISPCPAKATSIKSPLGDAKSAVDGVVSIAEVYPRLRIALNQITEVEDLARSSSIGVGWSVAGGESAGAGRAKYLAADGIENVITILEEMENDNIEPVDFIELNACVGGCVGGALTVKNPFIAKARLNRLMGVMMPVLPESDCPVDDMLWDEHIAYKPVLSLDDSITVAMAKLEKINELTNKFSGMDCGGCGAPSCRALAEDIVGGWASEDQCIFLLREHLRKLAEEQEQSSHFTNT